MLTMLLVCIHSLKDTWRVPPHQTQWWIPTWMILTGLKDTRWERIGNQPPFEQFFLGQAFDPKTTLGPCGSFPYGYVGEHVKPCIYIKLNKIWGWQPSPVQCDEYHRGSYDYDYECPPSLRRHLNSAAAMEAGEENIWIDCHGRSVWLQDGE